MPDVATPRRRRRWPWIVAAVLVVAFLFRGPLLAPVVAHVVAQQVAKAIDGHAEVAGAGGGWFFDAQLTGIRAEAPLGTVRRLHVRSCAATYGLGLLSGDPGALRSLTLDGIDATIDLRSGGGGGVIPPLLELLPSPLPQASLTGEVRLLTSNRDVRLSQVALHTSGERVTLAAQVQVADSEVLQVRAAFTRPTADTLRLERAVVLGDATVETLELVLGRARQHLTGSLVLGGGRCVLHADSTNARLVAEGLNLAAVPPSFVALLPSDIGVLRGTVAGEATAVHGASGWQVAGALRVRDLIFAGLGPFALDGQWQLGTDVVRVPRLNVVGPGEGTVTVDDLELAFDGRRPRTGAIHAAIVDVRRWLPADISVPPTPVALDADLRVEGDTFAIRTAKLTGGGVALDVRGSLVTAPWRIEAADVAARVDLAAIASLIPDAPNLAGELRLRATGTLPITNDPARLLAAACEVQVRGDELAVSSLALTKLHFDARSGDGVVRLTQGDVVVAGIPASVAAEARWNADGWQGTLTKLALALPGVQVTAAEPCPLLIARGGWSNGWSVGPLRLTSAAGALTLEARQRDGSGLLALSAPGVDLARLGFPELSGTTEASIELSGAWTAPQVDVRLSCRDLRIDAWQALVDVHLTQDQHGITVQRGLIQAGDHGSVKLDGTLPFVLGVAGLGVVQDDGRPATIALDVPRLDRWIPTRVATGALTFAVALGTASDPAAVQATVRYSGVRPVRASRPTMHHGVPPAQLDGEVVLTADGNGIAMTLAGSADGRPVLRGALQSAGAWDPVALWHDGHARPLAGRLQLDGADLGRFASAIPGVLHLDGQAQGEIAIGGSLGQPELTGDLTFSGVEAKIAELVPTLSGGRGRLELRDRRVRLHDAVADLGGELLRLSGDVELGAVPRLALTLTGSNLLLVQRHDARLRADLDLTLTGPVSALQLSGRTVATNALFTPDLGLFSGGGGTRGDGRVVPFEFNEGPLSTLRFDVAVSSAYGDGRDGVRLVTDLVRADCDLDLRVRGSGAAPELAGRVTVRKGVVFLPFSTLRLSTGELLFPEGDPFHPRLNAVATAQVRRWTIALQVDGPLSDPQVRAGGDGLDERDALLLLTTGSTSAELSGEEGQRAALGRLGTWLGAEAWDLIYGDGDPDSGPGILDRVTVQFGRQVSDAGNDTIEAEVELTNPDLVPGVLIYGERDRYDDYNAGFILRFRWGGER